MSFLFPKKGSRSKNYVPDKGIFGDVEYKEAYDKEMARHQKRALGAQVRADVTLARKTKEDIRREQRTKAFEAAKDVVGRKDKAYKNLGGKISIRKDALGRLKR